MPITFRLDDQPHELPSAWSELTPEQVVLAAGYAYLPDLPAQRLPLLRGLCPTVPLRTWRKLTAEQLYELSEQLRWILTTPPVVDLVEQFTHAGVTYLLPRPRLLDASAIEYGVACIHFMAFARPEPVPGALQHLVATLCRPERADYDPADPAQDGRRRQAYAADLANRRAESFADLPPAVATVVVERFAAAQRFIHKAYAALFKKPDTGSGSGRAPEAVSDGSEMLELLYTLAQEGTYGTYEQVAHTALHTVLYNLNKQAQRRDE